MDALERMPALEVLEIRDTLPRLPDGPSPGRIVDLPQLTMFSVDSTIPQCINVVNRVTIPTCARVNLSCRGTEATGGDFSGGYEDYIKSQRHLVSSRKRRYSQKKSDSGSPCPLF